MAQGTPAINSQMAQATGVESAPATSIQSAQATDIQDPGMHEEVLAGTRKMDSNNDNTWRRFFLSHIMDTLQIYYPDVPMENLLDYAIQCEEKIFLASTDKEHYLVMMSSRVTSLLKNLKRKKLKLEKLERRARGTPAIDTRIAHATDIQDPGTHAECSSGTAHYSSVSEMDSSNDNTWRSGLPKDGRRKIVERIMGTLQKFRHKPRTRPVSMEDLLKLAWRFEEKMFVAATDQEDYIQKISFRMVSWERSAQGWGVTDIQDAGAAGINPESK